MYIKDNVTNMPSGEILIEKNIIHSYTGGFMKKVPTAHGKLPMHLGIDRYSPLYKCTLQVPFI